MKTYSIKFIINCLISIVLLTVLSSCNGANNPPDENGATTNYLTCKINGTAFSATFLITEGTSGMIIAKGIKASNGTTYDNGAIRFTFRFGTNQSGVLGLGNHTVVTYLPTANQPNNQNLVEIGNVKINNLNSYVKQGEGFVNVEKYYETTYWQGAKGTFNNIKIHTFDTSTTPYKQDSVILTEGKFDFKYTY